MIAGINCITTMRARKPTKASTNPVLLYTLAVVPAKALDTATIETASTLNKILIQFMTSSFLWFDKKLPL
jgi:hypothetical protein